MNNQENIKETIGKFNVEKGKYVLHNGVEFDTLEEVSAFIKGLEYAQANANIGMDVVRNNSIRSLKDMEI